MSDNEIGIKITGDASSLKEATDQAKEQLEQAGKTVEKLGDLIGIKIPDSIKQMLASSEVIGPALAEAFAPLTAIVFAVEVLEKIAEKIEKLSDEAEEHRRAWEEVSSTLDGVTAKILESVDKQEQKYIEITQGPVAGMEYGFQHMRSVALVCFSDISGAMDKVAAELMKESSWFNANKETANDIKDTIEKMHKAMDDAANATPKDPLAPIIAQENVLNGAIKETQKLISDRSKNMGEDKSLLDPLKQEVALYENILEKLKLEEDLQKKAGETAQAEIAKTKAAAAKAATDKSITLKIADIDALRRESQAALQLQQATIRALHQAHAISDEEELALNKAAINQKFQQDQDALNQKLQQLNRDRQANKSQIIATQSEIKILQMQHDSELIRLDSEYNQQVERNMQQAMDKAAQRWQQLKAKIEQAQQIRLESQKNHEQAIGQLKEQELQFELQLGQISQAQYEKLLQQQLNTTYINERQKLEAKRAAAEGNLVQQEKIDAELQKLDDKYRAESEKANQQSLLRRRQQFDQYFQQVAGSFNSAMNSWIQGTETASQAFEKMFSGLLNSLVSFVEKWIEKKVEMWLEDKLITTTTQQGEAAAQISSNAAVAYSGAYASTAVIPFVGPELAPEAGMNAYMDVMSMEAFSSAGGDWRVDRDRLNFVHANETILPASIAGKLRNMVESGGSGGGPTVVVNHTVQAVDAASFQQHIRRHGNMIANEVTRALKRKA